MAGVAGANGVMVGAGGAVGPLSAEGLHAVLQHTFTPDTAQRKVRRNSPFFGLVLVLLYCLLNSALSENEQFCFGRPSSCVTCQPRLTRPRMLKNIHVLPEKLG